MHDIKFVIKLKERHYANSQTENPEFSDWKWINYDEITHNAVPFKKNVYQKIQSEFKNVLKDV